MREDLSDLAAGLEDRERAARLALIERLLDRGCTPGQIREAHERGRLTLLPLELTLRDEGSRTLEEIAADHGIDADALAATRRALGLPAQRGQPLYGRAVEGQARRLQTALEAGLPLDALVTINRVVGRAMATIASAARDTVETLLAQTDVDDSVRALRAAEAAEALAPRLRAGPRLRARRARARAGAARGGHAAGACRRARRPRRRDRLRRPRRLHGPRGPVGAERAGRGRRAAGGARLRCAAAGRARGQDDRRRGDAGLSGRARARRLRARADPRDRGQRPPADPRRRGGRPGRETGQASRGTQRVTGLLPDALGRTVHLHHDAVRRTELEPTELSGPWGRA